MGVVIQGGAGWLLTKRVQHQHNRTCVSQAFLTSWVDAQRIMMTPACCRALEEHLQWETRAKTCRDLLSDMLKSRLEATELAKQGYDLRPQPTKRDLLGACVRARRCLSQRRPPAPTCLPKRTPAAVSRPPGYMAPACRPRGVS